VYLLAFILSFFGVPIAADDLGLKQRAFAAPILLANIYAVGGILFVASRSAAVNDYRIAGLAVVGVWLAEVLSSGICSGPLIPALVDIRRDLAFRRIDPATAAKSAEIVLAGMEVADILQPYVAAVIERYELARAEFRQIADELSVFRKTTQSVPSSAASDSATLANAIASSIVTHQTRATDLIDAAKTALERLRVRVHWLAGISSKSNARFMREQVHERLDAALNQLKDETEAVNRELELLHVRDASIPNVQAA
jgi:hypothetical protein